MTIMTAAAMVAGAAAPAAADAYRTTFVALSRGQPGVLFQPTSKGPKAAIGVYAQHDNGDYLSPSTSEPCTKLAARGYTVLCANSTTAKTGFFSDDDVEKLLLNVKAGVTALRKVPGVTKLVLFGHSGGGEMMAAYQNIAEHGVAACRGVHFIVQCSDALAGMPAADGVMLIDAVLGGPTSTLISLDPAVIDEGDGMKLDPALDMYNPANGFRPGGSTYDEAFRRRFFAAQGARMNRLIDQAKARVALIDAGKGRFADDEPFVLAGAMGAMNRLNMQDLALQQHTRAAWPLLHGDGTVTTEIVYSVRVPRSERSPTPSYNRDAITTSVRRFLSTWAVRTTPDFGYDATSFKGIEYASSWAVAPSSLPGISKPILQIGMTGSYEFFNSEIARDYVTGTSDKTLMYVEGALHDFGACEACAIARGKPAGYYGDTVNTLFDAIDVWLAKPGRFLAAAR